MDLFGYEHIVFGTDTPYADIGEQIDRIEHIYSLNAKRILAI